MFVNIQSSWLRNKNTCMGNWHSLFWGCSQILLNNDSHIVSNNYKQFDHVCGETVCAYWHWTHLLSNKYKQFHHVRSQTVCAYWSWTHQQIQTVSPCMQSNCLCTLKLNSHCFKQIQSVWPCMCLQVLWVYEETHSWLWISMIFSVALMQNFTFLPWKLIASQSGFQGLNLFVLFHQHFCSSQYKVLPTMWTVWWWCGFLFKMCWK